MIEHYWEFRALSVEWLYVLEKLYRSIEPPKSGPPHAMMFVQQDKDAPLYMLNKRFYSAEVISRAIGKSVETLKAHRGEITLTAKYPASLPEATVSYWGEA